MRSSARSSQTSPAPDPDSPRPGRAAAARYRVYQLARSLLPRPLDASDRAILEDALPEAGRALFATMSANDQRHSLTVYRALWDRGCRDDELLAAALLHDSGKGSGRVPLWVRPPMVLLRAFAPGLLASLSRSERPWWRGPFYHAARHAQTGAELAERAGLSERTVLLIRTHHDPHGPAAELHAVDDAV